MRTGNSAAAALAVAGVLVASGVLPVGGTDDAAAARFPATGPMEAESLTHPDGLNHYVVHFPEAADTPAPSASMVRNPEPVRIPIPETGGIADAGALADLSSRSAVVALERDASGGLVAVVEAAGAAGAAGAGSADPHVAALAAVPGTRSVEAVGGGHFAVVSDAGPEGYAAVPGASVVEDPVLSVFGDTYYPYQWALENTGLTVSGIAGVAGADVGAKEAWAKADGSGVLVAVVDGGMQISHPDLAANIWRNPAETCGNGIDDDANGYVDDCTGWDFANNDSTVEDSGVNRYGQTIDNTHATHVAGIIAAVRDNDLGVAGLAPRAKILPVKLSDTGSWATSTSAQGIRYAADMGADVINCSFGTTGSVTMAQIPSLVDAVAYAISKGSLVVAAAGNSNRDIDISPTYPASLPNAGLLSVGASTNNDTRASFSNWGATSVDLFSPGWSILSTVPNSYGSMHGTSMAAPLASAAAALVIDDRPGLSAVDVKSLLMSGSTPVGPFAGLSVSGQRLDVGRVLNPSGDPEENDVAFSFNGFSGADDGATVEASVEATVLPDAVPAGSRVGYRATLMTSVGGATYGVSGAEIATEHGVLVTGDDASVELSPTGGYPADDANRSLPFGYSLPAGDYALVAEAYSVADGEPIGRPWAAFFTVTGPEQPVPAEEPTTTTTTSPAAQPPGGTTPTTQPPGPTTPTTQPGGTTSTTRPGSTGPAPQPGATTTTSRPGTTTPTTSPGGSTPTTQPGGSTPTTQPAGTTPTTPPGGTGAPSPTTPPTPVPTATTTTTTTRPPSTPPTLPPPADPETDGRLTVSRLDPRFGFTNGGERIQITGRGFQGTMHVLFGTSPGTGVSVVSSTVLLVTTPSRSSAGTVDVRVSTTLDSVVLDDAFTFLTPTPAPGPTTPTTAPAVTTPPTTSPGQPATTTTRPATASPSPTPTTTTTRPPGGTTPTTQPVTTTTVPGPTTTTTRPPPTPTRRFTFGPVSTTRGTLQLRPLSGSSPLSSYPPSTWSARRCTTVTCTGIRL